MPAVVVEFHHRVAFSPVPVTFMVFLNMLCGRKIEGLGRSVDKLSKDKFSLEQQMEMEEENIVNRLQRQLEYVERQYRTLERRMEASGVSPKDIGAEPLDLHCQ